MSMPVILILMKQAYERYNETKKLISIGEIASRHHDPSHIFSSHEFHTIQNIINSEELPIAMFLSNIKKLVSNSSQKISEFVKLEMANLSKLACSKDQIGELFCSHIQVLVKNRGVFNRVENVLRYCLDLHDFINIDAHFRSRVTKGRKFEENKFFIDRLQSDRNELLDEINDRGFEI